MPAMAIPLLTDRFIDFLRVVRAVVGARRAGGWLVQCGAAAQPVVMCPPRTHRDGRRPWSGGVSPAAWRGRWPTRAAAPLPGPERRRRAPRRGCPRGGGGGPGGAGRTCPAGEPPP